jgi:hypothetical protein
VSSLHRSHEVAFGDLGLAWNEHAVLLAELEFAADDGVSGDT